MTISAFIFLLVLEEQRVGKKKPQETIKLFKLLLISMGFAFGALLLLMGALNAIPHVEPNGLAQKLSGYFI